jgi:peptidoglycan/LPS O-acetylase OafA/YrhL
LFGGDKLRDDIHASSAHRDFFAGLESVRGIAALSVAFFHCISPLRIDGDLIFNKTIWQLHGWDQIALRVSSAIFSGSAPVSVFFVLSGFVLYRSLDNSLESGFTRMWRFVAQRFLRIYPAMAINLICMAGLIGLASQSEGFFPSWYTPPQGWHALWSNLLLVAPDINGATWTLKIELEAVPFILVGYYVLQIGRTAALVLIAASCSLIFVVPVSENSIWGFLFMFYLGMVSSYLMQCKKLQWKASGAIIAVCVIVFSRALLGYDSRVAILTEGLACAYVISFVAVGSFTLKRFLNARMLRFLGKISYSFYLYHPLLLPLLGFGVVYRLIPGADIISAPVLVLLTVSATFPVAWASFRYIEMPCQRLNKILAAREQNGR